MNKRIVIIDGNSLINRAYYAVKRPMITKEGIYTQGIYGFLHMLQKIKDDYTPAYLAVAWDRKAPTFRHRDYEGYKAGRKRMPLELAMELPIMKDILNAMKIPNLEIDGFEADDIIGTVARISEEEGLEPLIITGDKDALQLVTDVTQVLLTKKGVSSFEIYDKAAMLARYQLTPEQFIDLKGLMGDQSDNIPGIPGVGEKTGIKLLSQFGTMANLLANTEQIANEKLRLRVEENIQLAAMSRKLAEIHKYVPLDIDLTEFKVDTPDYTALIELYVKLEFNSFLKKLHATGIEVKDKEKNESESVEIKKYKLSSVNDLELMRRESQGAEAVLKVFSDNSHIDKPLLYGAALLVGENFYYVNLQEQDVKEAFIRFLEVQKFAYVGHELKQSYYALMHHGLDGVNTAYDTAIGQYVLEPSKSDYHLKTLVFESLHQELPDESRVWEESGQMDLLGHADAKYMEYGYAFAKAVVALRRLQEEQVKQQNLENILYEVELPLIEILAAMEVNGFVVSAKTLEEQGNGLRAEISALENKIYGLADAIFNINSPMQLGEILFEKLGLPAGKRTKRGYSTGADVLEKIRDAHPIVDLILQYRALTKLNNTYVEGLKPLIGKDGRIRAHFQQTVTATGRLSCTEPNLQNIPIKHEQGRLLRKAFIPSAGCTLVGADYSQIELRILAHLSEDENLIKAFNDGDDIHRNTAARIFNLDDDAVTPLDRSRAKAVNFGVIYGMSGFGLSENLNITRKEAEAYIEDYFNKHRAVKAYMDKEVANCKKFGFTGTLMGRKRYIHEINASNFMTRQAGERLAMNSPIQGTAADIIKLAMLKVYRGLKKGGYKSKLILQVHDELIMDVCLDEVEEIEKLLVENMEGAMKLKVKLDCDLNRGANWYQLK